MKFYHYVFVVASLYLTGCVTSPQPTLNLTTKAFKKETDIVGIYVKPAPAPNTYFDGANCLLCIAVVEGVNASLTSQVKTLDSQELNAIGEKIVKKLTKQGKRAKLITETLDLDQLKSRSSDLPYAAPYDYMPLKDSLGVSHLAVVEYNRLGVKRPYQSYIPVGSPVSFISGRSYLVDLETNQYQMYQNLELSVASEGEWNEGPDYPGLTTAYFLMLEKTKEKIDSLFEVKEAPKEVINAGDGITAEISE